MYYPSSIINNKDIGLNDIYVSQKRKQIVYDCKYIKLDNSIEIMFEEIDKENADLQVSIENISKGIEYDDIEMQGMLDAINIIYWDLFNKFKEQNSLQKIAIDTLMVKKNIQLDYSDIQLQKLVNDIYMENKPVKKEYASYLDKLFLFGIMGLRVSEIINK